MNTHQVIQAERERLALISSNKDPALFQAMRAHIRDRRTQNRSVLVNFADDETQFGCRFKCKFCSWRDRATAAGDIYPTYEGLKQFLDGFLGYKVTISGGGDPLFRLDQNWTRLYQLVDWIHRLGYLAEVVTKETHLVRNTLNASPCVIAKRPGLWQTVYNIDSYSLSYESHSPKIVEEVREISKHRLVRVSKVCSPGFSGRNRQFPDREWNFIDQYCAAMRAGGAYQILLREDANHIGELTDKDVESLRRAIIRGGGSVRWLKNEDCTDNLFLINNQVFLGETEWEDLQQTSSDSSSAA